MNRFEGKVAMVTGAGCVGPGWGNGRAIAVRLVEEGARVLAADRRGLGKAADRGAKPDAGSGRPSHASRQ